MCVLAEVLSDESMAKAIDRWCTHKRDLLPVLHRVCDIGSLDQMLNDDGRLTIDSVPVGLTAGSFTKRLFPSVVSECLQLFVADVGGHYGVDNQLSEPLLFVFVHTDCKT